MARLIGQSRRGGFIWILLLVVVALAVLAYGAAFGNLI